MPDFSTILELNLWLIFSIGLLWSHGAVFNSADHGQRLRLLYLDVFTALFVWVGLANEDLFARWMAEDSWAEWLTFFAFAAAGWLFCRQAMLHYKYQKVRPQITRWMVTILMLGTGAFCIFVAGEEISWGQRLFAFEPPEIFLKENFQQELNVHNLLKGKSLGDFKLESKYLVMLVAVVYGVLLPAALWLLRKKPRFEKLFVYGPRLYIAPFFAAVALGEMTYEVELTGEACEALLGLCFLAGALEVNSVARPRKGFWSQSRQTLVYGVGSLVLGLVSPPLLEFVVFGSDEKRVAETRLELQQLQTDLKSGDIVRSKLYRKSRVHKRVFTATESRYFFFEDKGAFLQGRWTPAEGDAAVDPRRDRVGYFLDPWNNPYWILWERDEGKVAVYSFGPNRRRDSEFDQDFALSGDDVGLIWKAP